MKFVFIIRFFLLFFYLLSLNYCSYLFKINISFFNISISLNYFSVLFLMSFFILEFHEYFKNNNNSICEFCHFFYWFFCLICYLCIYLSFFDYIFLLNPKAKLRSLTNYFSLEIIYTYECKLKLIKEMVYNYMIKKNTLSSEEKIFLTKIIEQFSKEYLLENPSLNINELISFIEFCLESSPRIFSKQFNNDSQIFVFIRNIALVAVSINLICFKIPFMLVSKCLKSKLLSMVKEYFLSQAPGVIFEMTSQEFDDFCILATEYLIKHYNSLRILKEIIKNMF